MRPVKARGLMGENMGLYGETRKKTFKNGNTCRKNNRVGHEEFGKRNQEDMHGGIITELRYPPSCGDR